MANTFKSGVARNIGTSPSTVYTCPGGTSAVITALTVANTTASPVNVSVEFVRSATGYYVVKDAPVVSGGTLVVIGTNNGKLVLEAADSIRVTSSAATSVDSIVSALEIS